MHITGETTFDAAPARVRAILSDAAAVGRLVPAARDLVAVGPGTWQGVLVAGVPPLGQRYPVRVTVEERGDGIAVHAVGTGRAAGMWLHADCVWAAGLSPDATHLTWRLEGELGGLGGWLGEAAGARLVAGLLDGLRRELVPPGDRG